MKNKKLQKILIIFGPAIAAVIIFLLFFYDPESTGAEQQQINSNEIALIDPEADGSEKLESKVDIYNREKESKEKLSRMKEGGVSDQDFFGGEVMDETEKKRLERYETLLNEQEKNNESREEKPKTKTRYVYVSKSKKEKTTNKQDESLPVDKKLPQNSFYSSHKKNKATPTKKNQQTSSETAGAVIHNDQQVKSGSTVRMRILEDFMIDGLKIPANSYISGVATFTNERIKVTISSFNYNGKIIYGSYAVYDQDGIEGIYVPGGITEEINKEGVDQGIRMNNIKVPVVGGLPSVVIKKKVDEPVVNVPSGYKLILKKAK